MSLGPTRDLMIGALGLLQVGALTAVPSLPPLVGEVMFWSGLTLLLASATYRLIEVFFKSRSLRTKSVFLQRFGKMPLADAARIAYQVSRGTYFSASAARFGARPNDILLFYCFHLARLVPLYGRRAPSTVLEPLSHATILDLRFSIDNSGVYAVELIGNNVYVDLCIDKKSLDRAIEHFKFVTAVGAAA